jgi:hypothetical protein
VVDAHEWLGWPVLDAGTGWNVVSGREREIVIGADENAPVGMCFAPVTDPKTVKNRVHPDLTSSAQDREQEIERLLALGHAGSTSGRPARVTFRPFSSVMPGQG